jgi:hypothetical protein
MRAAMFTRILITAGALLALGVRYAGSGCPVASDTLIAQVAAKGQ